jgi:hypothetical protein
MASGSACRTRSLRQRWMVRPNVIARTPQMMPTMRPVLCEVSLACRDRMDRCRLDIVLSI